jgi:hypothetical protein
MWCKSCRQDVPGLVSPHEKHYCCARCGAALAPPSASEREDPTPASSAGEIPARPPVGYDPWEINEKLRHVQRVLGGDQARPASLNSGILRRVDPPQHPIIGLNPQARVAKRGWVSALAWCLLAVGVTAFTCGGALTAWSLVATRDDLWDVGLPIVLVGQFGMLVGLVLHLDVLWQSSRQTESQMRQFDERLESMRHRLENN